jgi:hypothetical protein
MHGIGRLISLATCVALINACASTTVIRSTYPEAKIYVDGEYKGTGTVTHTDQKIVGSTTHVRLQAPNCRPETFSFARSEEFDVGACIGGFFVLVPWLWIMKYKPERTYEYECRPEQGGTMSIDRPSWVKDATGR